MKGCWRVFVWWDVSFRSLCGTIGPEDAGSVGMGPSGCKFGCCPALTPLCKGRLRSMCADARPRALETSQARFNRPAREP